MRDTGAKLSDEKNVSFLFRNIEFEELSQLDFFRKQSEVMINMLMHYLQVHILSSESEDIEKWGEEKCEICSGASLNWPPTHKDPRTDAEGGLLGVSLNSQDFP